MRGSPTSTMADEPTFATPWQAQAFGLAVALQEAGVFTAPEWAEALGAELAATDDTDGYYDAWVRALCGLLTRRAIMTPAELDALTASWQRAAHATPHGQPITLANDPHR